MSVSQQYMRSLRLQRCIRDQAPAGHLGPHERFHNVFPDHHHDALHGVCEALREGKFYTSTGPEIYDFYVEDGIAHVECSSVKMIKFQYGHLPSRVFRSRHRLLTQAEYKLPEYFTYVRATIMDAQGNRA